MQEKDLTTIKNFHQFSTAHYQTFWQMMLEKLAIKFTIPPKQIVDLTRGVEAPTWLPGAEFNIIDSCFRAYPTQTAIIFEDTDKQIQHLSYAELNRLSNRIANSLVAAEFKAGDAIAIIMPMNVYAIAIYLGIIKMGGIVVSIADSFSSQEIATRLKIADAKAVFTQDEIRWGQKSLPLYEKIQAANPDKIIVIPAGKNLTADLRKQDYVWQTFLLDKDNFTSVACTAMTPCNILFSSGTTAEPKAIVWNHSTLIKVASDAYLHQNIQAQDVLAWPTNLGWMMGPWLIFAALINQASIAVFSGAPKDRDFGEFIQNTHVTMLGVVPTLVAHWRQTHCMQGLDWSHIKVFSSTGECSNPEDMFYLMYLADYKPIIEYCGGTEIGGAYISSTVIENNYPSVFTTPTMGLDFLIIDENGKPANIGEVAIIPPSIGLSTQLLNANHQKVYFDNMPSIDDRVLRRHGDQIQRFENGYFCILGRADDAMNLGGIKISAAEIERSVVGLPGIAEIAAIAITPPNNGPSQLVIYAATQEQLDKKTILQAMQARINAQLNPLFKIHDVVFTNELPKTASNKIMRRILRKGYLERLS